MKKKGTEKNQTSKMIALNQTISIAALVYLTQIPQLKGKD